MNLVTTKILVAILFGFLRFFCGVLPIKIYACLKCWEKEEEGAKFINEKRHQQVNCYLALFQSFSGGVLFATCFLHMMPAVWESVIELRKYGDIVTKFPYSQLVICVGFFVIYFIEELSHWLISITNDECLMEKNKKKKKKKNKRTITPAVEIIPNGKINLNGFLDEKSGNNINIACITTISEKLSGDEKSVVAYFTPVKEKLPSLRYVEDECEDEEENNQKEDFDNELKDETVVEDEMEPVKELEKIIERQAKTRQQILRCILIILALSFHAIFEGLAIGLQKSIPDIWYLFTAVSIHSAAILFCITLELLIARAKMRSILVHVLLLSITSPLGVLTGLIITMTTDMDTHAKSIAVVFLEGFSAGTILYITFFEVLKREKERRIYSFRRAVFILAGFILMAVLEYAEIYH